MEKNIEQLVPFLKDILKHVKESEESIYDYFSAENKRSFKDRFLYGSTSLFEGDAAAQKNRQEFTDALFGKMLKDFHFGTAHLYLPNSEGKFNEKNIYDLAKTISEKEPIAPQAAAETASATTKRFARIPNIEIIEELKLNSNSGLVEGKIRNLKDGKIMNAKVDPHVPELIHFSDDEGKANFVLENSDSQMSLWGSLKNTESVAEFVAPTASPTTSQAASSPDEATPSEAMPVGMTGAPTPASPTQATPTRSIQPPDSSKVTSGRSEQESEQESFEETLRTKRGLPFQQKIAGEKVIKPQPNFEQGSTTMSDYSLKDELPIGPARQSGQQRTTEENLKQQEKDQPEQTRDAREQRKPAEKDNKVEQKRKKKESSSAGLTALKWIGGGVGVGLTGITGFVTIIC